MSEEAKTLEWHEHIRLRPGLYIGKLGDGSYRDDGMYGLIKEVMDNSVDEFLLGYGKRLELYIDETSNRITIRDYGRGISFNKLFDVATKMYDSTKCNSKTFKKSIGITSEGTGLKVVNAMSSNLYIQSFRNKYTQGITFAKGLFVKDYAETYTVDPDGTYIGFTPDKTLFGKYRINPEYVIQMIKNYTYLNVGLTIVYNRKFYFSHNGLLDLLNENMKSPGLYSPIHFKADDIELAICHDSVWGAEFYSFVNGLQTWKGTHVRAFCKAYVKTIREFYEIDYKESDILSYITVAISIKIQEPVFESAQPTTLGSKYMYSDEKLTISDFITDFVQKELSKYLHFHPDVAAIIRGMIEKSDRRQTNNIKK